jgi:hypothetical protein
VKANTVHATSGCAMLCMAVLRHANVEFHESTMARQGREPNTKEVPEIKNHFVISTRLYSLLSDVQSDDQRI